MFRLKCNNNVIELTPWYDIGTREPTSLDIKVSGCEDYDGAYVSVTMELVSDEVSELYEYLKELLDDK